MTSPLPPENPTPSSPGRGPSSSKEKIQKGFQQLRAASLGWNFVTAPLVGGAMGYGLDWLLGTYPWIMIAGFILGFVSAFIEVLRGVR